MWTSAILFTICHLAQSTQDFIIHLMILCGFCGVQVEHLNITLRWVQCSIPQSYSSMSTLVANLGTHTAAWGVFCCYGFFHSRNELWFIMKWTLIDEDISFVIHEEIIMVSLRSKQTQPLVLKWQQQYPLLLHLSDLCWIEFFFLVCWGIEVLWSNGVWLMS